MFATLYNTSDAGEIITYRHLNIYTYIYYINFILISLELQYLQLHSLQSVSPVSVPTTAIVRLCYYNQKHVVKTF